MSPMTRWRIAMLVWLLVMPINGTSPQCSQCLDTFKKEHDGTDYDTDKNKYCTVREKMMTCSDDNKCKPDAETTEFQFTRLGVEIQITKHCNFNYLCQQCLQTYFDIKKGIRYDDKNIKLCNNVRNFFQCGDDANCDPKKVGGAFSQFSIVFDFLFWHYCGNDCTKCVMDYELESRNIGDTEDSAAICRVSKKFVKCARDGKCEEDDTQLVKYKYLLVDAKMGASLFCGYSVQCAQCFETYLTEKKNLPRYGRRPRDCNVNRKFLNCIKEILCDRNEQGFMFQFTVNAVESSVTNLCPPDKCEFEAANECIEQMNIELPEITAGMLKKHAYCTMSTVQRDCIVNNGCQQDYRLLSNLQYLEGVYMEKECHYTNNSKWTTFQRRTSGELDFYRNWAEYKAGFRGSNGDMWLGLEKMHQLTSSKPYEMRIEFTYNGQEYYAEYSSFKIGSEAEKYTLYISGFSSNGFTDSLWSQSHSSKFSTKDVDNDEYSHGNCAIMYHGAWWYRQCHTAHFNGQWGSKVSGVGLNWLSVTTLEDSATSTKMMMRPKISVKEECARSQATGCIDDETLEYKNSIRGLSHPDGNCTMARKFEACIIDHACEDDVGSHATNYELVQAVVKLYNCTKAGRSRNDGASLCQGTWVVVLMAAIVTHRFLQVSLE